MNVNQFVENFTKAIREDNAAIFAGAGLSSGAGFVNWKELLKDVADELNLNVDREEHDLVGLAQYYCNSHMGRGGLNQIIMDEFQQRACITENHRILSRLPIKTYWTTNYDTLIETALRDNGKNADIKLTQENLALTLEGRDAIVYKMHGDVSQVHNAVITRDDYERYETTHAMYTTALQGDLVSKTFLFIGFSFNDPNLNYILSRIRIRLEGNQRPHYCLMKKVKESDEDYAYSKAKQDLYINDLQRFSINTILVDEYSDVTDILKSIEQRFKKNSIFISGSAEEYGAFSELEAAGMLHDISNSLIKNDYTIISGFGKGVGSYIINGAIQEVELNSKRCLEDNLVLRPFPQKSSGETSLDVLWENYRVKMIRESGIAIFVFGNKMNADRKSIINAQGIQREFEIAEQFGVKIIPVGITGYQTKLIYEYVMSKFDIYYPELQHIKSQFEILGISTDCDEIVSTIVKIVNEIRRKN